MSTGTGLGSELFLGGPWSLIQLEYYFTSHLS